MESPPSSSTTRSSASAPASPRCRVRPAFCATAPSSTPPSWGSGRTPANSSSSSAATAPSCAAERFHGSGVPLMGVNLGHVGFLADSEREDLAAAVHRASQRDYSVEERLALDVSVWHEGENIFNAWALNEATIEKTSKSRIVDVVLGVDARPVSSFGCDGVILATPTGSTAYSFSAGGPIVWPEVEALILVPISAHALFAEPLVVNPNSRLGVEISPGNPDFSAVLWCDGRRALELP